MAKAKAAIRAANLPRVSNADLAKYAALKYPNFQQYLGEGTQTLLTSRGFDQITKLDPESAPKAFGLMLQVYLDQVNLARVKNTLSETGLATKRAARSLGEYAQRVQVYGLKPVTPAYRDLAYGESVDQQIVRLPEMGQRFFGPNYDFQNFFTLPDGWNFKRIFTEDYGISEVTAGFFEELSNSVIKSDYAVTKEALSAAISGSDEYPLKVTQVVDIPYGPKPTVDQLIETVTAIIDLIEMVTEAQPSSTAWNEMGFDTANYRDQFVLILKPGVKTRLVTYASRVYNDNNLFINIPMVTVNNFGGLKPFADAEFTTPVYPVFDKLGVQVGWNTTEGATTATLNDEQIFWQDPHEGVLGVLIDKDKIVHIVPNELEIGPSPYNRRGMYTNFWANCPNQTVAVDRLKPMVVLMAAAYTE